MTCPCGRGKVSAHDGKCGHCRSRREQRALMRKLEEKANPRWTLLGQFEKIGKVGS